MEITVTGRHIEVTPPIKTYAQDKVQKLPRYFDRVTQIEVILDKGENHSFETELRVHVDRHEPFIARSHREDLYASIDDSVDKMERQLTDHKEKLRNHKHAPQR